jgi:hypothetical protein
VLLAGGFCAVVLEEAALWSGVVLLAGGFCAVVLDAAALWSAVVLLGALGVCAGGFTGALALSEDDPAGLVVVAAGALALLASVVGVVLLAEGWFAALWSADVDGAAELGALLLALGLVEDAAPAAEVPAAAPAPEAWLLVQESEIMLTELTCMEPSLARVPET